jgi:ribosome-associated protein
MALSLWRPDQPREWTISTIFQRPTDPGLDLAKMIEASLDADKAEDISVIDLQGKTSIADTMIIASGRSSRQVGAMAQHLVEKLKNQGIYATLEGMSTCDWVLIDAGDVVIHLFRPEVRAFYNLEKMWSAATPAQAGILGKPSAPQHMQGFGA